MKKRTLFWKVLGIVFSLLAPGSGHLLDGMWLRGASWLGGVFAGAAFIYYVFPAADLAAYSVFGLVMALLATRDLFLKQEGMVDKNEEPIILKPNENS
jgi:hypothetical protein